VYIFCEGKKTEPNYIRAYIKMFYPACARLKDAEKPVTLQDTVKNTPKQLVNEAVTFSKSLDFKKDQVWVMYDRESPAKYTDDNHGQAWLNAKRNGVHVALSNVCFEYWLLLHLTETSQPANSFDDLIGTVAFKSAFREIGFSNYQKGEARVAEELITKDRVENAKSRARRINKQAQAGCPAPDIELPYRLNPYTNVYEVLDAIDKVAG
jgi:hypothetical protein